MFLGDSSRRREGTSRGPHDVLVGAGLWPSTLRPSGGFPAGGKSVAGREEASASSALLEDLRRRLVRAFQRAVPRGGSRRSREEAAAREEQSRARVESALAGLRTELLEMHFQNHQLARTLLDLNMKMQQLKKEYELEVASESQSSEDNAVNLE
ncbi:alanine and arginine-rich domain-containing protein [Hippopotamus amphibius kiboko]|uniref:alanine and arginine-rich domain-containing protein n=1 Tax=Hippopotamus amphibius kiboko TaxID=575201 RepID=UPI0025920C45|nr:alanine and arginine-rich domain-containing protein [Hippopotamus amphibius kiboko]